LKVKDDVAQGGLIMTGEIPLGSVEIVLNLLYETFKLLHKTELEKFEKEWKDDRQKLLEAVKNGDADTINALNNKYSNPF
jgi:hypothetical protein